MRRTLVIILVFCQVLLLAQEERYYTIGVSQQSTDYLYKRDVGISIGRFYKKNYSQISFLYGFSFEPGIFNAYSIPLVKDCFGLGLIQRYYPNGNRRLFSSFFELDLRLSRNSCDNVDPDINYFSTPTKISRNFLGMFLGYGIAIKLPYNFSIIHSIAFGKSFVYGKDIYYFNNVFLKVVNNRFESDYRLNISIVYNLMRVKTSISN